jgi:hypothetical protein
LYLYFSGTNQQSLSSGAINNVFADVGTVDDFANSAAAPCCGFHWFLFLRVLFFKAAVYSVKINLLCNNQLHKQYVQTC